MIRSVVQMASNFFGDYSRLRSIARKRAERLTSAGLADLITFPTVKELKEKGITPAQAVKSVQAYLSAPTKTREYRRIDAADRPVFIPTSTGAIVTSKDKEKQERVKAQNRERSRRYRERVRNLTKQQKSYIKAARTLGLHITPSNAAAFAEYMDFRFAQGGDSVFYKIARYVEDYMSVIAKKGYSPSEILNDFNLFLSDRSVLMGNAAEMQGYPAEDIDSLFEEFLED